MYSQYKNRLDYKRSVAEQPCLTEIPSDLDSLSRTCSPKTIFVVKIPKPET